MFSSTTSDVLKSLQVGVKLVKDEVPEILENGISDGPLLHAGKQELEHHVVGEQDLRGASRIACRRSSFSWPVYWPKVMGKARPVFLS